MARYLEAFFRHPLLLLTPVIVALVAAMTYTVAQPRVYSATMTVWFSPSQAVDASGNPISPDTSSAAKAVSVFQELIKSRSFDLTVGNNGKLGAYFASHPPDRNGIMGAIRSVASKVGLSSSTGSLSGGAVDDAVVSSVGAGVTVAATGPQLAQITVDGPSADTAAATAAATYQAFSDQVIAARRAELQDAVNFYQVSTTDAKAAVVAANTALSQYIAGHPVQGAGTIARTDLTESGLLSDASQAQQRYQTSVDHLNTTRLALDSAVANPNFKVVDTPQSGSAQSITRKVVLSSIGGVAVGLLLVLTLLVLITAADRTMRRPDDVERALGLRVGGIVPRLRKLPTQEA